MGMGESSIEIESLRSEQHLELLERLCESLSQVPGAVPVTDAQRAELDRRSEALDRDLAEERAVGVPWEEVVRQLRLRR
jgi:putative addiction module component (TIGR02574 family)